MDENTALAPPMTGEQLVRIIGAVELELRSEFRERLDAKIARYTQEVQFAAIPWPGADHLRPGLEALKAKLDADDFDPSEEKPSHHGIPWPGAVLPDFVRNSFTYQVRSEATLFLHFNIDSGDQWARSDAWIPRRETLRPLAEAERDDVLRVVEDIFGVAEHWEADRWLSIHVAYRAGPKLMAWVSGAGGQA